MLLVVLTFFVHHLCFLIFASEGGKTIELDFYQALKHSLTKRAGEREGERERQKERERRGGKAPRVRTFGCVQVRMGVCVNSLPSMLKCECVRASE